MVRFSWRASRTCGNASAKALRWDILRSRSPAELAWSMVASSSATSQSIVSSIIVGQKDLLATRLPARAINSDAVIADGRAADPAASSTTAPITERPRGRRPPVPGHWEADFMLFARYGQGLLVLHERQTPLRHRSAPRDRKAARTASTIARHSANSTADAQNRQLSTTEPSSPSITWLHKAHRRRDLLLRSP